MAVSCRCLKWNRQRRDPGEERAGVLGKRMERQTIDALRGVEEDLAMLVGAILVTGVREPHN